jgi:hypothetical protein
MRRLIQEGIEGKSFLAVAMWYLFNIAIIGPVVVIAELSAASIFILAFVVVGAQFYITYKRH